MQKTYPPLIYNWRIIMATTGFDVDFGSTSITGVTAGTATISGNTYYNTNYSFEVKNDKNKGISLGLYFKYVKSKMKTMELRKFKKKAARLQQFIISAEDLDQRALVETLQSKLVLILDQMELLSVGIQYHVNKKDIDKHKRNIYDWDEKIIDLCKLEDYPRVVPASIKRKIKKRKEEGLFKEYWVLYIRAPEDDEVKTNKQKIREKDPILFGKMESSEEFYYIADWVDEHCDLTLEKFISDVKDSDPEYKIAEIPEFDDAYICDLRQQVKDRAERLKNTNMDNYRDLMKEEDVIVADDSALPTKPWWKFWG